MKQTDISRALTREDLEEIIHNIPDTIIVYDREGNDLIHSDIVNEHREKRNSATGTLRAQIDQSEREISYALKTVLATGKPMTFIHKSPHYEYPTLFTVRPVFGSNGQVRFAVSDGRSQAVINKFSREYIKMEQRLEASRESLQVLNQLHLRDTEIVAESPAMKKVLKDVYRIAKTDSTVTIVGESGTGKEIIANIIHQNSLRKDNLFIPVNCSAIPPELMESEFFGYAAGAFTGAKSGGSVGLFELANHGTLFLDEIGELPLALQPKLLRVLESGEIRQVGAGKSKKVDVRIIAATNRNLEEMVRAKEFREDLYYRLQIIPIKLPPLRDRPEDILPMAEHYLRIYNKKHRRCCYLTDEAREELTHYTWPGNIRELRNLIERLVIISDTDAILQIHLLSQKTDLQRVTAEPAFHLPDETQNYYDAVTRFEKAFIKRAIMHCGGDVAKAAEQMGVHKSMVYKKLKKFKENNE